MLCQKNNARSEKIEWIIFDDRYDPLLYNVQRIHHKGLDRVVEKVQAFQLLQLVIQWKS